MARSEHRVAVMRLTCWIRSKRRRTNQRIGGKCGGLYPPGDLLLCSGSRGETVQCCTWARREPPLPLVSDPSRSRSRRCRLNGVVCVNYVLMTRRTDSGWAPCRASSHVPRRHRVSQLTETWEACLRVLAYIFIIRVRATDTFYFSTLNATYLAKTHQI